MKAKNIISFLLLLSAFFVAGQDLSKEKIEVNRKLYTIPSDSFYLLRYEKLLLNEVAKYDFGKNSSGIAIQPKLFDEKINEIFNTVVFSNSDLASNGSAIGYQKDDEKQTVSVNGVTKLSNKNNWFLKFGVNATGASAPYNLYSTDSWNSSVGGNIGIVYKWKASTFYSDNDAEKSNIKRLKFIDYIIKVKIANASKLNDVNEKLKNLNPSKTDYYHKRDSLNTIKEQLDEFNTIFKEITINKINQSELFFPNPFESKPIVEDYDTYSKAINYIKNELYEFDKKNDITYGYSMHWFDLDFSLNNSTYKFNKENIDATLYETLNETLGFDKKQDKLKIASQFSYNYTRKGRNLAGFLKGGVGFNSGSFLSSNLLVGTPKINENQNIVDESTIPDAIIKGNFNTINKNLSYGNLSFYGALFIGKNQKFGVNINLKHHYLINKPDDVFYKNNFTAFVGPLFKATGAENKGVIVGLDFGYDNLLYKTKINDFFTARLRVGIPFTIFTKK